MGEEEALYSCILWEKPVLGVECKRICVIKHCGARRWCPLAWNHLDSLKHLHFTSFLDLSEIIWVAPCAPCKLEDASKDECRQTYVLPVAWAGQMRASCDPSAVFVALARCCAWISVSCWEAGPFAQALHTYTITHFWTIPGSCLCQPEEPMATCISLV